jgi:hypothetical protein
LVGSRLNAYQPRVFKKESKHPKFYWFDPGVAWATTGNSFGEIPIEYKGYQSSRGSKDLNIFLEFNYLKEAQVKAATS